MNHVTKLFSAPQYPNSSITRLWSRLEVYSSTSSLLTVFSARQRNFRVNLWLLRALSGLSSLCLQVEKDRLSLKTTNCFRFNFSYKTSVHLEWTDLATHRGLLCTSAAAGACTWHKRSLGGAMVQSNIMQHRNSNVANTLHQWVSTSGP